METSLQQRLVGAVVLVALGVILVPALLDGSGFKTRHERNIEIPARPLLPALEQVKIEPVVIPAPVVISQQQVESTNKPAQKPAQNKEPAPARAIQSWTLQVGTFSQENNALAFRDGLRKQGYTAYVESGRSNAETSYRVFIGPELDKEQLEKIKTKMKTEKKINAFILRYPQ